MDPALALKLLIVGSIILIVLSIGLSAPAGSIRAGLRDRAAVGRAMLSMFVALPLFALLVTWFLPLDPAARVALLALTVSPMPPILPMKEQKLGGGLDYALAIQVTASIVAFIAAPLLLLVATQIYEKQAGFDAVSIARTMLITIIMPLGAGIVLAARAPAFAARLAPPLRTIALLMLGVGLALVVWKAAPGIRAAATGPTLAAVLLITVGGLALGHVLGGPEVGNRHALAIATASRHPGIAIGLASATDLAARQPIVAVVLLYLLAGVLLGAPYAHWAKRRL